MSIETATADGRAAAESRMVDACTIAHPGGEPVFDPSSGTYTDPASTTIYSGKCEVQVSDGLNARETEAGGTELTVSRVTVKVPVSATGVRVGDVVTITAVHPDGDADLVGQEFSVKGPHGKTFATARRLQVERVTA